MTGTRSGDEAIAHLAAKVHDHSSVLQAVQVDIQHIVRSIEKLTVVSEKQADLANQISRHSDSIDRAFRQMDMHKSDLTASIDRLAEALRDDRENHKKTSETVLEFRSGLRTIKYAWGGIVTLLFVIAVMYSTVNEKDKVRTDAQIAAVQDALERRKLSVDLRLDDLTQKVQEVRLDRQRDREENEGKRR